jgi:hypothetical protein
MKPLLPNRFISNVAKRQSRGSAILYAVFVTLSLMWIELLFRYFTAQNIWTSDLIHILLLNASIAFIFTSILSIIPSAYHRLSTLLFISVFAIGGPVYTTLTASHIQYGQLDFLLTPDLLNLYEMRYEQYISSEYWLFALSVVWLLVPFKIKRQQKQSVTLLLTTSLIVLFGFSYWTNPIYANTTEQSTNWELLLYQDNPGITRSRMGINQGTLQTVINRTLFIRPTEQDVLGEISSYLEENDTLQRTNVSNFRSKNLVVFQIEGLTNRVIRPEVMPFVSETLFPNSITFTNYYSDQKEINNYGVNFPLLTGIPLIPQSQNTIEDYAFNNYEFALPNLFRSNGYNTIAFHQFYSRYEDTFIENTGFRRQFDYFDFNVNIQNDLEFVEESFDIVLTDRQFLAYYHLNNPHASRSTPIVESLRSSARDEDELLYLSEMALIDQAILDVYLTLDREGYLENTVIMIVGHNPRLNNLDVSAPGRLFFYRVPMFIWSNGVQRTETETMGAIDVIPTLMSFFRFDPDNNYIGTNIFAPGQNIVGFVDGSWVSNAGYYDSYTKRFVIRDQTFDTPFLSNYVDSTTQRLKDRYRIARLILERNYFGQESV